MPALLPLSVGAELERRPARFHIEMSPFDLGIFRQHQSASLQIRFDGVSVCPFLDATLGFDKARHSRIGLGLSLPNLRQIIHCNAEAHIALGILLDKPTHQEEGYFRRQSSICARSHICVCSLGHITFSLKQLSALQMSPAEAGAMFA